MRIRSSVVAAGVLVISSVVAAQTAPGAGQVKLHTLKFGDKDRTVRVWVPPGYDPAAVDRRYPVIYLSDGQNLFASPTAPFGGWKVDSSLAQLVHDGKVNAPIVVGIDNGGNDRIGELTFTPNNGMGGNGAAYDAFVMNIVVPFVEAAYRVRTDREHTVIGGSSLGATMALELAIRHPEKFGKVMAMSASLWWDRESIPREVAADATPLKNTYIYLDIGAHEGPAGPGQAAMVEIAKHFGLILAQAGVKGQLVLDPDGEHNEVAWARRFPAAIQALLPPATATTRPTSGRSPAATQP